jgi:hypothetical protein
MKDQESISKISEALDETIRLYKLKGADIAQFAGINPGELSRVRKGDKDILSTTFVKIALALPLPARLYFLVKLGLMTFKSGEAFGEA